MFTTYFPKTLSFAYVEKKISQQKKVVFLIYFLKFVRKVRLKIQYVKGQYVNKIKSDLFTLYCIPKPINRALKQI